VGNQTRISALGIRASDGSNFLKAGENPVALDSTVSHYANVHQTAMVKIQGNIEIRLKSTSMCFSTIQSHKGKPTTLSQLQLNKDG
jgi:hypothetical protein